MGLKRYPAACPARRTAQIYTIPAKGQAALAEARLKIAALADKVLEAQRGTG